MARNIDQVAGIAEARHALVELNRRFLRFINTVSVTWTLTDNPVDNEIQVEATSSGGGGSFPSGSVIDFAGSVLPSGWLECDGSPVNRITYAALFAAIGTTWGAGDGVTTFNLPNLNRRTTVGRNGTGTGTLGNTIGSTGGAETHTLSTAEMPSHAHGVNDAGHTHTLTLRETGGSTPDSLPPAANTTSVSSTSPATTSSSSTGISIQNAGSGSAHNNIQPSAVVMKIIKV